MKQCAMERQGDAWVFVNGQGRLSIKRQWQGAVWQHITWTIESHSLMLERNWLPRPSPLLAPFTSPAMSTNSTVVGTCCTVGGRQSRGRRHERRSGQGLTIFWVLDILPRISKRRSGTATMPMLGSIVQKGKLAAWAFPFFTRALKRVDCKFEEGYGGETELTTTEQLLCGMSVGAAIRGPWCYPLPWYPTACVSIIRTTSHYSRALAVAVPVDEYPHAMGDRQQAAAGQKFVLAGAVLTPCAGGLTLPTLGSPTMAVFNDMVTTDDLDGNRTRRRSFGS